MSITEWKWDKFSFLANFEGCTKTTVAPGETISRFVSSYIGFAGDIVLTLTTIDPELDFSSDFNLVYWDSNGRNDDYIVLYERGQGKVSFLWWDYVIFAAILLLSLGIGIYFGFFGKKQSSQEQYLLGNRKMSAIPVSLSLLASFMSAITLLGVPSETTVYGTQYIMIGLCFPIVAVISAYIFLPIFYNLELTSVYEYLELRFSKPVKILGASCFVLQMMFYISMVIYIPSLALEAIIDLNLWISCLSSAIVCIFYTSVG